MSNIDYDQKFSVVLVICVFAAVLLGLFTYFKYDTLKVNVKEIGVFAENRLETVLGQDGVNSIDCGAITMWTFADTLIGEKPKHQVTVDSTFDGKFKSMKSNTIAFTHSIKDPDPNKATFHFYQKDGSAVEFIKYLPGENKLTRRFWANDGINIGATVYVYYMQVKLTGDARLFEVDGVGVATWKREGYWWSIGDPVEFKRNDNIFKTNITFGDSVVEYKNYIYVIGHYVENKKGRIKIARVNKFEIINPKAYRYLNSNGEWVEDIRNASGFFDSVCGELSMSVNNDYFTFFYCSLEGKIYQVNTKKLEELSQAKHMMIYQPEKIQSDKPLMMYYSAKEVYSDKDNFYVVYMNPKNYQPILLKVEKQFF